MANIETTDEITHDRETVFKTYRDELVELVPHLPDIEDITVESREEIDDNTTKLVNIWEAEPQEVPRVARSFIKPEMLKWTDYATWREDDWECDWEIEVGFLPDTVSCKGTNRYLEKGEGKTEIMIDGELSVDASKISGVPKFGSGKIGNIVENFVVKLITPNLTKVNRGIEKYLASKGE